MEILNLISTFMGASWASGVNVYLTVAGLGIAGRMGWIALPGSLDGITSLPVIIIAVLMYAVEFVADKIPFVDSAWDSIHTFIRPAGAFIMTNMATSGSAPAIQMSLSLLSGGIALDSHLTKATARAAINTSPEPVTNSVASVTEDGLVLGVLWLIIKHPIIAGLLVIAFIAFSVWFLKKMFHFIKGVFSFFGKKKKEEIQEAQAKKTSENIEQH